MHDTERTELSAPLFPAFSPLPFLGSLLTYSKPTHCRPRSTVPVSELSSNHFDKSQIPFAQSVILPYQ
ncbi:hypothetical protein CABS01_04427 [Colletotrichum abscissum]|uniref:Uncharacterized protein n=2 Tax=Colletotrichum acutatum species complex TaxID=2707335 RepID=A0A9Q0B404_9PEZI|nr:uncharacterized protein CLUP02_05580 [Colletotrichum lupini]XP_060390643.1 uncharacterized protein CABS01_04427 [Colletotrichum abscissum]KAI3556290.1 hypothetical protein CABS02_03573 [Colletotrichum abscissum]KAK1473765.1 hypothetical protein CABS01_04427 [Colletotrichum abscissum]UQC80098.1 hypothetical protein CLUP02_05580 [Colletotrichum lupini]